MKRIMVQFAMDGAASRSLDEAVEIIDLAAPYVDIIEAGTSFILRYGIEAPRRFKKEFGSKIILADMKIMDGGYHHAAMGCDNGADIVTVMGAAHEDTIKGVVLAAHEREKEAMVDLMGIVDLQKSIEICESAAADYICIHTGVDAQAAGDDPLSSLQQAISLTRNCKVAVAGGISLETLPEIVECRPDVIIVGSAIHGSEDPGLAASKIRAAIDSLERSAL